ncbi:Tm-1-like ATP-binding domain-containing protein [Salipaludibacillus sp. CF4.18]|uniref:Tm-1-like ATP-binding domain-containing protein n=1 Tax=Salipaludibacillus sp. CF4.18 TaxID=3373081 RepID=UPI003EE6B668
MGKKVLMIGSLDTKEEEFLFVKKIVEKNGIEVILMNTGIYESKLTGDITSAEVAKVGGHEISVLREKNDRGTAVATMTKGANTMVQKLLSEDSISGIFGMGGTAGTTVAGTAMQSAPVGLPKVLVSTVASGNTRPYVGDKDITMMYSVVDIAGINSLSANILKNAANAISGMVQLADNAPKIEKRPMIAATMFGVTTPCVTKTREILESKGYDVLVFHATGTGGDAMESLIQDGFIEGVVDITTTEFADLLVGGIFSPGDDRLESASKHGIPQVVSVGALDMVNFGPPETVPKEFKDRLFYQHNSTTTLMRTTVEENRQLGKMIADKLNKAHDKTIVVLPKGGVSMLDTVGQAFEGNEQRKVLFNTIKENLADHIPYIEVEEDINDSSVSQLMADELLKLM